MKFIKKNVADIYGYMEVRWYIDESIEHIADGGYIIKNGSSWNAYDGNGKWLPIGNPRKKEWCIEALYDYSKAIQNGIDDRQAEEDAYMRKNALERAYGEFKKIEVCMAKDENVYNVGDMINIELGSFSKPNSVADYFGVIYSYDNARKCVAKVINVIEIENSEYDIWIDDFYSGEVVEKIDGLLIGGGNASDNDIFEGVSMNSIFNNEHLMKVWNDSNYELVNVIVSKGRKSIMVNPEGFSYVRYMGFAV